MNKGALAKAGWQTKKLNDFSMAISTGPFGSLLHKSDYVDDGVPLVNPINMVNEGISPDPSMLISETTRQRLSNYALEEGDIVVARRGEIGRCAVVGSCEAGWLCGTGSFFVRPLPSIDSQFLAYLIRSGTYREKLEQAATGTTMKNLSNAALSDLVVSIPPLPEQQRIVGILDEAFDGIAAAKANAEKNLQNARALFESHLQSVFTQRDQGWPEKKLGEVADVQSGGTPLVSRKEYWNGKIPWYSSGELNGLLTTDPERHVTTAGLESSNAKLFPTGSLLIGMYDTAALKMSILDRDGTFNQAIAGVRPNDAIEMQFLFYAINAAKARLLLERRGVRQKNLSLGKIKDITIPVPNRSEQRETVSCLQALSAQTQHLESICRQKLAALDALKKSLLDQAFNGVL
jgi:type I restriction enzyme S subunit